MEENNDGNYKYPPAFYDKCTCDDENLQAKIKPILNQIHENRVTIKELHIQYGVRFSEMINLYRNRLEDLKDHYEALILDLQSRQNMVLNSCNEILSGEKMNKN